MCVYNSGGEGGRSMYGFGETLRIWLASFTGRIMPASLRVGERGAARLRNTGRVAAATAMVAMLVSYISLQNQQGMLRWEIENGRQLFRVFGPERLSQKVRQNLKK